MWSTSRCPRSSIRSGRSTRTRPILHENVGSNLACHRLLDYGDVDAAFAEADLVLRERLVFPRYTSMPLETFGVVSSYDPFDGGLTVWSNFMGPFIMHPITARALNIPENRLRFIVPERHRRQLRHQDEHLPLSHA